ncbi:MAG: hypothetical protein HC821_01180, partial [Lewinella sp.]|nr:hypothetical protein [Lewinella sp.]
ALASLASVLTQPELDFYDPNGLRPAQQQLSERWRPPNKDIGILEEFTSGYELSPTNPVNLVASELQRPVRSKTSTELTVASSNVLFLVNDQSNYPTQLTKVVNYLANSLDFPDVIALQELGGQAELEDLIFRLRQANPERGDYRGFVGSGPGSIHCAFLVKRYLSNPVFLELGTSELLSSGGILHDRPPLLLRLRLPQDPQTELQVLNLHLRSLNGIETEAFVRRKRYEQSLSVARMVENLRSENLIVLGDLNAFEFSDGYVDVVNQIAGTPSLGALSPVLPIVNPPLLQVAQRLAAAERYSFVFNGSAQQLDHCLANNLTGLTINELAFARGNADAAVNYGSVPLVELRAADHDAFVLYLGIDLLSSTVASPEANGGRKAKFTVPKSRSAR